jgi:hypothetical protein
MTGDRWWHSGSTGKETRFKNQDGSSGMRGISMPKVYGMSHAGLILMSMPFNVSCAVQCVGRRRRREKVALLLAKRQG